MLLKLYKSIKKCIAMSQVMTRAKKRSLDSQTDESSTSSGNNSQSQSPVKKIRLKNVTNIKSSKEMTNKTEQKTQDNMLDSQSGELTLTQASQTQTKKPDLIEIFQCVKLSLEDSYKNVVERLNLEIVPKCFYNLKNCCKTHSTTFEQPTILKSIEIVGSHHLEEESYFEFILYANSCIMSKKEFPGVKIIQGILEAIMVSDAEMQTQLFLRFLIESLQKYPNDEKHKNAKVLSSLHHLVCNIFQKFPSCQWRKFYLTLVQSPIKVSKIKNEPASKLGIFHIILNLLNDLIYQREDSKIVEKRKSDSEINIYQWMAQENEKSSFINLPRVEKFERIFLVLDALGALLEQDLAVFMIKCMGKLSSSITNSSHRPLICTVIWKDYESFTAINETTKILISIYAEMIALRYPRANVKIIARFLNLISHVVNVIDCPNENSIPNYGNCNINLARELFNRLEQSTKKSHNFYIDAIDNIPSPLIKMLLATEILQNLHKSKFAPLSLSVPCNLILKKEFLKFNSTEMLEGESMSDEKYPAPSQTLSQTNTRRAIKAEITENCYLKLLLLLSSSINHFYGTVSSYRELQKLSSSTSEFTADDMKPENCAAHSPLLSSQSSSSSLDNVDLNEEVSMRRVDLSFKKSVHIKLTMETCFFYRNEMKHLTLLTKLIKKCHEKYGEERFREWMKFVESMNIG